MQRFRSLNTVCIVFAFAIAVAIASSAQTFKTLVVFDGNDGGLPVWALVQGADGNFYGSTTFGGTGNAGTIFRVTPTGTLTTLAPIGYAHMPVQGTDGNFYGTTPFGGPRDAGTIFRMTSKGSATVLYSFCALTGCGDGQSPYGGVVQAADGNFYGTTSAGGANNNGTVFKITPAGTLTTIVSFDSVGLAGTQLVQGVDGNFYGTTSDGGTNSDGTIFKVTPKGKLTTLHTFDFEDGKFPYDALIQGADGNFYGTTYSGGANDPQACEGIGCGTVFKMTPSGKLTTLYNFCSQSGCVDGHWPSGSLIQATDGNFYGATEAGGANGTNCPFGLCGTVFKITPKGELTTLHSFAGSDGSDPYSGLVQGTDGILYGTTNMGADLNCGGGTGCGTLFSLSVGLRPFVETRPVTGHVGEKVIVIGNVLKSATGLSFNGTAAAFKVVSNFEIVTKVPVGATTGSVEVTTSKRVLKSNVVFRVAK